MPARSSSRHADDFPDLDDALGTLKRRVREYSQGGRYGRITLEIVMQQGAVKQLLVGETESLQPRIVPVPQSP